MNLRELKSNSKYLLLNCVSGSHAYGLAVSTSDTDYKGIFLLPKDEYYSLDYTEQISNETNDIVYYELRRFIDLLVKNNPNILELLYTPADCVVFRHEVIESIKPELFLSKLCKDTFAGYAMTQVKRAKGLNKKISNPIDKELKTILDFCYIQHLQGSLGLINWLINNNIKQEDCGLIALPHMRDMFAVFHKQQMSNGNSLKGIYSGEKANDVLLSTVPNNIQPIALMHFNKDGYSKYCKEYKEYWDWVDKRNDARYKSTIEHGKNYDAKNMMHVFRLLNTAEEIALEKRVNVRRPDRDFLLKIRNGEFFYEDLVERATEKIERIKILFESCDLPETPNKELANQLLIELRKEAYKLLG